MVSRTVCALHEDMWWSGISAVGYGIASLAIVCLNHQVLDDWAFPSSTYILSVQTFLTLVAAAWSRWVWTSGDRASTSASELVATTAPKMAALFVVDVALGLAATRTLGIDAFATFRRFSIPFALHLETKRPSIAVCGAAWSMVLGPLLGLFCGRGRAKSLAASASSRAASTAAAYAESAQQVSSLILGTAPAKRHRRLPTPAFRLDGPWDATTWSGCACSLGSASVAAGRVVILRRALLKSRDLRDDDTLCEPSNGRVRYYHRKLVHRFPDPSAVRHCPSRSKLDRLDLESSSMFNRQRRPASTVPKSEVSRALLASTAAFSLPLVLAFGLAFDLPGLRATSHSKLWASADFLTTFLVLATMGPVHEAAIYSCVGHNSALTCLVSGGFKSTALETYRTTVGVALAAEDAPADPTTDKWNAIALAISTAASLVYTYEWWSQTKAKALDATSKGTASASQGTPAPQRLSADADADRLLGDPELASPHHNNPGGGDS